MHIKQFCYICGHELRHEQYTEFGIGVVEEYNNCSNCNYSYAYAYGNYQEIFGHNVFDWSYHLYDNTNKEHNFFKKLNKAKFMSRRNWRKGLKHKYKEN
jgi:hypothetical protein